VILDKHLDTDQRLNSITAIRGHLLPMTTMFGRHP